MAIVASPNQDQIAKKTILSKLDLLLASLESLFPDIKTHTLQALKRLGLENMRDLLFYKPYSYRNFAYDIPLDNINADQLVNISVTIEDILVPDTKKLPTKIYATNETGFVVLVFFNKIHPFIYSKLRIGASFRVSGKIQKNNEHLQIVHPDFHFSNNAFSSSNHKHSVEAIYHLTYGITNNQVRDYVLKSITVLASLLGTFGSKKLEDLMDQTISDEISSYIQELLIDLKTIHMIGDHPNINNLENAFQQSLRNLAEKELNANQLSLARMRMMEHNASGKAFIVNNELKQRALDNLGFELTPSQASAIAEIELDQQSHKSMMRLLQGDVGSGKTLVSLLTMLNVVDKNSKNQSVLMCPTDILSNQHYVFFQKALKGTNIIIALLTGSTKRKDKIKILQSLLTGEIDILIGTHALFQENVIFYNLSYVIIDEQHRFGVAQRESLISKASNPDVLVMTATPIPRSLSLTIFGDMDISAIRSKPSNRLPIITNILSMTKDKEVISSLKRIIDLGQRIYWICPLIEQNNELQDNMLQDINARYHELESAYPNMVSIIHGKMKQIDKDILMENFKNGIVKILVATTVIEVGIDVPEASLIVIENAEMFGLSQLHQLRGRVGRGNSQSYCILLYQPKRLSAIGKERLNIIKKTTDGFLIAEQDLMLRGAGDILGTKQSGEPEFYFADIKRDLDLLNKASSAAPTLLRDNRRVDFILYQEKLFAKI